MPTLDSIVDAWFVKAIEVYPAAARGGMIETGNRFRNPVASSLRDSLRVLATELAGSMDDGAVVAALDAIVRVRAVQDCSPEQAIGFAAQLREVIREQQAEALFQDLEKRIETLVLAASRQYALCKNDIVRVRSGEARRLQGLEPWMRQTL